MKARLLNAWEKVSGSLWFVPSLMAASALGASALTLWLDAVLLVNGGRIGIFTGGASGARSILQVIAGSMIGVTGVTFSITIVALSLASSQLGPRLLRKFMQDKSNQFVLGTFIGTFVYCLSGLQAIDATTERGGVPQLTLLVGFVLALTSLGVLIFFIHHIASSIQADTVVGNVARDLDEMIDRLYPTQVGDAVPVPGTERLPKDFENSALVVYAHHSGYVQAVDADALMDLAMRHDLVAQLLYRPGNFVSVGAEIARIWPAPAEDNGGDRERIVERMNDVLILGDRRTEEQDVEFMIDQIVEVGVRALSPGINDPFTAVACVDRLGAALSQMAMRRFPPPIRMDADGKVRVLVDRTTFEGAMDAAFHLIRQSAATSVPVTMRLLEAFKRIAESIEAHPERASVVLKHARLVHATSRQGRHIEADQEEIEQRFTTVLQALGVSDAEGYSHPA